ncbi:hypothetical protein B5M09_002673 [Aphanomyces astaci]|uniref:CMP/dCMP-type deaminase domain-containing protein n=1 Tax=Aphanomyces astaci TaxID=112090 RepID=A0A425C2Y2_APHAT|nr:hypothetical protein B5M09_002673 [Aphanomyces astaci]
MAETTPAKRKRDMEIAMNEPHDSSPTPSRSAKVHKRKDYLSWDDYFMSVAFLNPSTQVGAWYSSRTSLLVGCRLVCERPHMYEHNSIVNAEKKIVGIGYNGFPNGCDDDVLPWARQAESPLDTKYPIYVALFPCNECAKLIIQVQLTPCSNTLTSVALEWYHQGVLDGPSRVLFDGMRVASPPQATHATAANNRKDSHSMHDATKAHDLLKSQELFLSVVLDWQQHESTDTSVHGDSSAPSEQVYTSSFESSEGSDHEGGAATRLMNFTRNAKPAKPPMDHDPSPTKYD